MKMCINYLLFLNAQLKFKIIWTRISQFVRLQNGVFFKTSYLFIYFFKQVVKRSVRVMEVPLV